MNGFQFCMTALVLWMLAWVPMASSAATACCDGLCVSDLAGQIKDAQKTLKQTQREYVKTNMKDFCQRNLMLRFLDANNGAPSEPYAMPLSELEKIVDNKTATVGYSTPWDLTLRSTEDSRNSATKVFISFINSNSDQFVEMGYKEKLNLENFDTLMSIAKPASPREIESVRKSINESQKMGTDDIENGSKKTQALKTAACLEISIFKMSDCVRALNILQEDMSPVRGGGGSPVVDTKLWKRVLGDNKYDEGIRLASLKLVDRLKNKNTDKANIFDDLKTSFTQSGMSPKAADDATWDVLAMISSGGPNTVKRVSFLEPSPTQRGIGLGFIAVALGSLDYMKMKRGQGMYSYPPNIKTNCDNAKPYHFWIAAHMARTLVNEHGFSPETAEQATFIAMKGYQMQRSAFGGQSKNFNKSDGQKLSESDSYSPVQQVVRTDLAFAAAGTVHGANSSQNKNINVDHIIQSLMDDSNDLEPVSSSEKKGMIETYLRFRRVFSPDTALEAAGK